MKSTRLPSGATYFAHEHNALRSDAAAAAWLHVHQQLGALALGTAPTNGQTVTFDINSSNVQFQAVTGSPTNPGDVKAPGTAAGFVANLYAALLNPTTSTSTFVALSAPNAQLIQYLGWALPSGGTTITPFSLNTSTYGPLTSFSASTTVTSGSWTAQTMELYVEPGTYYVGITRVLFLGASTPTITAPVSNPRIDLVTADSTGTIAIVTGSENASPSAPSYPAGKLVLAEIYNVVGETALYDSDNQQTGQGYVSNDVRPAMAPPYLSDPSQVGFAASVLVQTGMIMMWSTTSAPSGWLFCQGQAVSRTTYATLYALIGTTYGIGDGTTTFNVPDMRGRVPVGVGTGTGGGASGNGAPTGGSALTSHSLADWLGEETHVLSSGEMPSHSHNVTVYSITSGASDGAGAGNTSGSTNWATSSTGGGGAHNTMQPVLALEFIIKI